MEYLIKQYKKKTGTDVSKNLRALGKLKCEVEKAKWTLSSQQSTRIEIESFEDGNDFSETLTRAKFEELNMDLFRKTMKPVEQVLKDANVKEAIAEVVLVSGSTRIPKVQQLLKEYFGGKEPSKGINPDEAVACGAAVQGGILSGAEETSGVVLADVYLSFSVSRQLVAFSPNSFLVIPSFPPANLGSSRLPPINNPLFSFRSSRVSIRLPKTTMCLIQTL